MDSFEIVRSTASKLYATITNDGKPRTPLELVNAAAVHLGIDVIWLEPGNPSLKGARALFDHQSGAVFAEQSGDDAARALLVAHELGHVCVHATSAECSSEDIDPSRSAESAPDGMQRVEDYGARERRELQADVFAREFVLPREVAARLYAQRGMPAATIALELKLPIPLVKQQLLDAIFLPPIEQNDGEKDANEAPKALPDPAQDTAAAHRGSPFQLQAGPGTGKTRTLVKRVLSLLDENVDPASILILTFSNRAAGELAERIAAVASEKAAQIWIGTFHSFGLDLVRRHYDKLSLPADPALFDRSDAIAVLEEILPTLPLNHFRNLWDPVMVLKDVLSAISRAKDELVNEDQYLELAKAQRKAAAEGDEEAIEAAEECLEIAEIYKRYEEAKRKRGAVDFGDLIMAPVKLIETDAGVRAAIELRHRHVLIDEYQDVNRASVRLIKAISGDARRLWVVGDARQSIYRFRGASSTNMDGFNKDFPNATIDKLGVSYRSTKKIIDMFSALAPRMGASKGMLPLTLKPNRGEGTARPELRSFETEREENLGIASAVLELQKHGVKFKDQAILCRSNARLDDIAELLEQQNIPVLHLGSLFEREEIRDLLAILSLAIDPFGDALVRVARLPRYALPLQDIYKVSTTLRERRAPILERLDELSDVKELSPAGQKGIQQLVGDLRSLSAKQGPWDFLTSYLFDASAIARELAKVTTVSGRMQNVAIWQFLNFLRDQPIVSFGSPIQRVLERVRRLVLLAEERDLRQVPESALHIDAVRLMTVHGSKGLEFEAVHIPALTDGSFPLNYRRERCPPPQGMIEDSSERNVADMAKEFHDQEEECLFFVALSRARTHLRLYQSRRYPKGRSRQSSKLLAKIDGSLLGTTTMSVSQNTNSDSEERDLINIQRPSDYALTDQRLERYQNCPRRFFYTYILGLGGARKVTPFSQTHDCVYEAMRWLSEARQSGNPTQAQAEAAFEEIWKAQGPHDHAFAPDYRKLASRLLGTLIRSGEGRKFRKAEPLPIDLANGRVMVEPNEIATLADGTVVLRRVRTGRRADKEYDGLEYTLYHLAGETHFRGNFAVEALHLSDDLMESVPPISATKVKNRTKMTDEILGAINSGDFPTDGDPVKCPRCPHFFICPSVPDGSVSI